jgi:hypothetical protein
MPGGATDQRFTVHRADDFGLVLELFDSQHNLKRSHL